MPTDRRESAYRFRVEAAEAARNRTHPVHEANADEARYGAACYPMSFTKGLDHDEKTGLVAEASDFEAFRTAIDNGFVEPFTTRVPVPRDKPRRQWEAPTAGVVFELQGPDPQAVTMPPAPELCSDELTYEMAEVYELALLRDEDFAAFQNGGAASGKLTDAINRLNALPYNIDGTEGRPRKNVGGNLDKQTAFRGSSPGVDKGPYLSQFMLIGNRRRDGAVTPKDGFIGFGAQTIDQRVLQAKTYDDYMMTRKEWLHVQKGFDPGGFGQNVSGTRFICTLRDLATYVHIDALYQAYLNACLLLLGHGAPFDPAFDLLSGNGGHEILVNTASDQKVGVNAGGFALWGGPHILSLVTEVATRGLKAVRFQKFNVHARLRPEALAGRLEYATEIEAAHASICGAFSKMVDDLHSTEGCKTSLLHAIKDHNKKHGGAATVLLPMAFAEGSPMHPAYGAGHATVAGACVTMLKAFFDTSAIFVRISNKSSGDEMDARFVNKAQLKDLVKDSKLVVEAGAYYAKKGKDHLQFDAYGKFSYSKKHDEVSYKGSCPLTLEGELNKLAANISIGRNMAGVHYFTDYFDSARMGEEIAVGILEEQALGYQNDRFVKSLPTFDGDSKRIGRA
ncbi:MAG: bromoperoxidase [Pseudomonadota bacterium]